jgi:hypothetical protein
MPIRIAAAVGRRVVCLVVLGLSGVASWAAPVHLRFELQSLAEPSRYEYRYELQNTSLGAGVGWFSIDFDPSLYDTGTLAISGAPTGWDAQLLQPAFGLPAQFDIFSSSGVLAAGGTEVGFAVQFTWLGAGLPGAQRFQVWDSQTFDISFDGVTSSASQTVPEPGALALTLLALAALAAASGRTTKNKTNPSA